MQREPPRAPASSPCQRDDAEAQSRGQASRDEILTLCNELLAAERAGARVTWRLRDAATEAELGALLDRVHEDERASCRLLLDVIAYLGGEAHQQVGDFEGKVMALTDETERMALLNRGQTWVIRRLAEILPRVGDGEVASRLQHMLTLHEKNVDAATQWLAGRP